MATKPELNIAEYGKDISSVQYNDNFDKLNDYIEAVSEELTLKVNTINSQLSSNVLSNLQSIYPVGSLYIGTTDTCPIANLFGTWEKIEEGLCLQSVKGDQVVGTTIKAGLPNITGEVGCVVEYSGRSKVSGAFKRGSLVFGVDTGSGISAYNTTFNASNLSSIYKDDCTTVQPPAYLVNIWKRTA